MSKILVIGHTVLDKIYYNNKITLKPGGIFHTMNTLVNLIENEDEIYLATQFSKKSFNLLEEVYEKVNLEHSEVTESIPTVTLNLYDDRERDEHFSQTTKKINVKNIEFSQFDIILINMISGFDIGIEELKNIRENFNKTIYFDLHTLSRGADENGNREFRVIPEIDKWLINIDILQMNDNEIFTLFGNIDKSKIISKVLNYGVKNIIITKGKNGVSIFNRDGQFSLSSISVNSKNFVGCGDSFGAAFTLHFSKNNDLSSALVFANLVAGIITTYNETKDFKNLKYDTTKKYN